MAEKVTELPDLDYSGRPDFGDRVTSVRWQICALLFVATTINYMDRSVLGILKPTLDDKFHWTEIQYGHITLWFQCAYAIGALVAGRIIDRVGVRVGYSLAVSVWSLAAIATGSANSVIQFGFARFGLGLAEGGNFPAAIKTVGEWFPKKERALATGIFNAGSNIGGCITPVVAVYLALHFGWRSAFVLIGVLGILWMIVWAIVYRHPAEHPNVSPAELAHIQHDPPDPSVKIPWASLLKYRALWAFAATAFFTSPVWWYYLFWTPDFLKHRFHLTQQQIEWPITAIYLIASVGSIGGGYISSTMIRRGFTVNMARKTAMLICALAVVPVYFAPHMTNPWAATMLIALAASAHQGWSANAFTLASDTFPRFAVSSVVGFGTLAGSVAAMGYSELAGHVVQWTGSFTILFAIGSSAYLFSLLIVQILLPRIEPINTAEFDVPGFPVVPPVGDE